MKQLFFISLLLAFISCSQVDRVEESIQEMHTSASQTRSMAMDIDKDELENSPLLNELRSFNDSLNAVTHAAEANSFFPYIIQKKTAEVEVVDMVAYVIGYDLAKRAGLSHQEATTLALVKSGIASICEAISSIAPKLPPVATRTFKDYENVLSAAIHQPSYSILARSQYEQLGDMRMFENYRNYFTTGINHNLLINKYRAGLSSEDIIIDMFDNNTRDIIYSDDFQTMLSEEMNRMQYADTDFYYLFADKANMVITFSQQKAAESMKLYTEAVLNNATTLSRLKAITYRYMSATSQSLEIDPSEKIILLNSFPIALMSGALWTSITNSDTE